ncbi:CTD small phosphatase-like protein isoform X2 [Arapaima gigas]
MDNTSIITQVSNPKEEEIISSSQEKVSQSNSSLKKQRSRSIFSTFFCCFRSYNVDPPSSNNNTNSLPPPVEENGTLPKPPTKYLLPEMNISDYGKKCVVIDLDETLVHSSFKPISNADFIVPVEIDGTVHQATRSQRKRLPLSQVRLQRDRAAPDGPEAELRVSLEMQKVMFVLLRQTVNLLSVAVLTETKQLSS